MKKLVISLLILFVLGFGVFALFKKDDSNNGMDENRPEEETDHPEDEEINDEIIVREGFSMIFGKVQEVSNEDEYYQILVANESTEEGIEKIYLYIGETPIIDLKTGEFSTNYEFKKGEKIQYFLKDNTPVMQSLPPKSNPNFIGINVEEGEYSLDVDRFDKKGHGISNRLDLNLSDDLIAEDIKGKEVEDFLNKDLAVLYTIATRSNPPIASPDKIIVLD